MKGMDASSHIDDLAAFVTASPSSYHAAAEVARRLGDAGYVPLDETADWREAVRPGARLTVVREGSVIALALPAGAGAGTPFRILGAHTDSPGFKLKPKPTLAAFGWLDPVIAGAAMAASSVSVVGNALLLRRFEPRSSI